MNEHEHDPRARECVVTGVSVQLLHDRPCPACRELSQLVDLDPDYGSAVDGRPCARVDPDRDLT